MGRFKVFSDLCQGKNASFYNGVDKKVSAPVLHQAAGVAADIPFDPVLQCRRFPSDPVRQDDVIPSLKFFRDVQLRATISFDHEVAVAMAYAYLGKGLEATFECDMRHIFR